MRSGFLFLAVFVILILSCNNDDVALDMEADVDEDNIVRVVGYLPTYRFHLSDKIEYCKLTHLNLSFANPDSREILLCPVLPLWFLMLEQITQI